MLASGSRAFTGAIESLYPGEQPFKLRLDITDLPPYRSDVTSTNCWPTCTAAQLQGSFSRPFIHVGYRRFTRLFPTFISRPCHRRSFNVYSSRVNDFSTFPALRWIASESFDRDSANLYRTLDVWSADKRREGKRREREEDGILISIFARGRVVVRDMLMRDQIIADGMELKYLGRLNVIVETFVYRVLANEWKFKCFQSFVWKFSF